MRRQKRRLVYYRELSLYDGTILAVWPSRKPLPKTMKFENIKIDEDGVCDKGRYDAGKDISDSYNKNRFRFMDILANRLNTRRAMREIIIPHLSKLENEVESLHQKLDQMQQLLANQAVAKS